MPLYFGNTPISNVAATIESSNSSGGGAVETCTVNIVIEDVEQWEMGKGVYTVIYTQSTEAGLIIAGRVDSSSLSYVIDDVVCGTLIMVVDGSYLMPTIIGDSNMEEIANATRPYIGAFITPTVKGTAGTITLL